MTNETIHIVADALIKDKKLTTDEFWDVISVLEDSKEVTTNCNKLGDITVEQNDSVGFKSDEIFLISEKEYRKYEHIIPSINTWWWLRSSCSKSSSHGLDVDGYYGNVCFGKDVSDLIAVRPVLKIDESALSNRLNVGDVFVKYNHPWVKIDNNLFIAKVPIGFERFDDNYNDYENSYIRLWLLHWIKENN